MALTEQFPLNVTVSGDTVKDGVLKNRKEILALMDHVENQQVSGGVGSARQRVLGGKTIGDKFNFLSSDNLQVTIDGSLVPVIITFANGFNETGAVDYIEKITNKISAWSLARSSISYLYVERDTGGNLTYGSVHVNPIVSNTIPTNVENDLHWYNPKTAKMAVYNGVEWVNKLRVFVAIAVTNASTVESLKYMELASEFSLDDAKKLKGIQANAEVNQNAFSVVSVNSKEVNAGAKTDTLTLQIDEPLTVKTDISSKKITIAFNDNGIKESINQLNSTMQSSLQTKQDKGDYAHLVNGKVPKTELPKLETWLNDENIKTGSMEVWKYD